MRGDKHIIVWEGRDARSIECLGWQVVEKSIRVDSHLSGIIDNTPFAVSYHIETDLDWKVLKIAVSDLLEPGNNFHLKSNGNGNWYKGNEPLDLADGCIDIDITLTPFTNTLPIRRLSWRPGEKQTIRVLYIELPAFHIAISEQHYTQLDPKTFLFESGDEFNATLSLDENGFVINYPKIAQRIYPGD